MRCLIVVSAIAFGVSSPALAQHKPAPMPTMTVLAGVETQPTGELCRAVKTPKVITRQARNHGGNVTLTPTWPNGKPLSPTEVKLMLKACEAKSS
jgi:hypothetical protein